LDVITGTIIKDYNIKKLTIDYKYKKLGKYRKKYKEQTTIDFSQYATMLIYISEIDELKGSVDNLLKEVKEIKKLIPSTKIGDTHASKITE
jgi:endo-1,4-beta-D-glucanase Y